MQDLCPLCLKNGLKKNVKLLQINLQEAVWVCEEEKCVWPFGYEDFVLCPRAVGKIWSCYWNDYKSTTLRPKDNVNTSIKPALCATPIPLDQNILEEFNVSLDTCSSNNINDKSDNLNELQGKTELSDLCTSAHVGPSTPSHISNEQQSNKDNCILNNESVPRANNLNDSLLSVGNSTKNIILENGGENSLNKHVQKKDSVSMENVKNVSTVRGIPKITNIEICNLKIGNQISRYQDVDKKIIHFNKATTVTKSKSAPEIERLSSSDSSENNKTIPKSNLSVTKMEIDGLPPITLSFEIPVCITKPETVISNTKWTDTKNSVKRNSPEIKNKVPKRNTTSGKQYEKFSFSAIKKKVETNNSITTSSNNNSSHIETKTKIDAIGNDSKDNNKKKESVENINNLGTIGFSNNCKRTIPNVHSSTCTLNQLDNSITNLSSQEVVTSDTLTVNTSMNLDTVLEDLLSNDYSVSEDLNDEWINSLLS